MKKKSANAHQKPSKARLKSLRFKFVLYGSTLLVLALIALSIYVFAVRPTNQANLYSQSLQHAADKLYGSLTKLAGSTQYAVFNNPDGTAAQHLKDLNTTTSLIAATHSSVLVFQRAADNLESLPHFPFINSYRDAQIAQQHSADLVSQTNDVLTQYTQLVTFLKQYYTLDGTFVELTTKINNVNNLDTLIPSANTIYSDGQTLAKLAAQTSKLAPPPGYTTLLTHAAAIYKQAAQGLSTLAYGLSANYDLYKNSGISLVEEAANQHDDMLVDIPTNLDQSSYILVQVNELPDKIDSILAAKTSGD